jgi:hypothetical protein
MPGAKDGDEERVQADECPFAEDIRSLRGEVEEKREAERTQPLD